MHQITRHWQWYHWILLTLRVMWLSHIVIIVWRQPELFTSPISVILTLSVVVFVIPFLLQPLNHTWYLLAEIGLAGLFSIFLAQQTAELSWQFIIFACMIGFFSLSRTYLWIALSSVLIISVSIGWAADKLQYETWITYMLNHGLSFALGYGWQLFVLTQQQNEIIQEQRRVLEQHLTKIEQLTIMEERNRLSRELHDTIGHTLTSIIVGIESMRPSCPQALDARLETIVNLARRGLDNIRKQLHHLSQPQSPLLLTESLQQLVEEFTKSTGVTVHFRIFGHEAKVSKRFSFCLHRCLQEALTNAVRHGKANTLSIHLFFDEHELRLQIEDNGVGIEHVNFGFGLSGMKERLMELSGQMSIHSTPDVGTLIVCSLPLKRELNKEISIMLVDDQPVITESLQRILEQQQGFTIVGTAAQGHDALEQCAVHRPDIVLMDVQMPGMNGIEALRQIKQQWPEIRVIMLTTFEDMEQAALSLQLGAEGYLLKSIRPQELAEAIKVISNGGTWIDQGIAIQVFKEMRQQRELLNSSLVRSEQEHPYGLTKRELDILLHMANGLRYKSIAGKMFLSEGTIRNYCSSLYSKLGVSNREDAIAKARQERLFEAGGASNLVLK
ncbi:hybrid sensor histidine kinase/response regulator transcription factor [Paenibacillus sp. N3/727]|uniref:helix-turn-helix transcriptional regulator n=1 Tax=Paenibacillus sp. N3/727 TaxID=2925845 RepID=UPI001F53B64B|nr:hybrid sensor histidine kinase/response regulator transcription factor [Paenibacillus sp. N3/727]UNK19534.1 hybrid sensor histidine kinase/response regulator transcription factor [Paenibacillus sp. N3/727]